MIRTFLSFLLLRRGGGGGGEVNFPEMGHMRGMQESL